MQSSTISLAEQAAATLEDAVNEHSLGLDTTIFADDVVLQSINTGVPSGILGLLGVSRKGKPCGARAIKQLNSPESVFPDGPHALFLVGSVSWPATSWPGIARILQRGAFTRCTLCVATSEQLWRDVEAAFPGHAITLTSAGVSSALLELLRQGQHAESAFLEPGAVQVHSLPLISVSPLHGDLFLLPDLHDMFPFPDAGHHNKLLDRASLSIISLLHGLGLEGNFYSLGDMAKRISRRCSSLMQRGNKVPGGGERATVVFVDRTLDLVAPMHHGGHLLDQLFRVLTEATLSGDAGATRDSMTDKSLLSVLRDDDCPLPMNMWETCFEHDKSVALQLIRRSLVGHLAQLNAESKTKGAMPPTTGKVTAEQLQRIIDICQDLDTDDVQAVLSVAQAVANAEATSGKERWSEIESAEKTIKLVMGGIKDSLGEMVGSSRRSGERAEVLEAEETQEMDAAWNQLLAAIPALSPGMLEACASEEPESLALEALTRRWLWRHTPAPGMVLMAASLLAPTKAGIPAGQRARVEQRLVDDYAAVFQAVARGHKGAWSAGAAQGAAQRWAARVVEYAGLVAVSEGQRSRVAQWRELVGLSRGMDGVYSPLCARVASDVLRGDSGCADLEHAEQGTAVAAANLLKGLGRRFLSGKPAAGASDGPSSTDQLPPRGAGEAAARSATVLFFVVGGITFEEAALVAAAARQHGGARRVLVGGTSISTAAGLAHLAGLA